MTTYPRPSDSVCRDLPELLELAMLSAGEGAGAGFPVGRIVASAQAIGADLIVNGCDRELGSGKNAYVLTAHLAEVAAGAAAITSGSVRYAVPRGTEVHDVLRRAAVPVLPVPDRSVGRDDASLVSLAQGGLARPMTDGAPFIFGGTDPAGESIKPTVVLSAESVWLVAQILSNGPQWFRSLGWPTEPGPRLVTIGGTAALGVPAILSPAAASLRGAGCSRPGPACPSAVYSTPRGPAGCAPGRCSWVAWRVVGCRQGALGVRNGRPTRCPHSECHQAPASSLSCRPPSARCAWSGRCLPMRRARAPHSVGLAGAGFRRWHANGAPWPRGKGPPWRRLSAGCRCWLLVVGASSLRAWQPSRQARCGSSAANWWRTPRRWAPAQEQAMVRAPSPSWPPTASSRCTSEPLRPTPPPMTITSGHNRWARFTTAAPAAHIVRSQAR